MPPAVTERVDFQGEITSTDTGAINRPDAWGFDALIVINNKNKGNQSFDIVKLYKRVVVITYATNSDWESVCPVGNNIATESIHTIDVWWLDGSILYNTVNYIIGRVAVIKYATSSTWESRCPVENNPDIGVISTTDLWGLDCSVS